MRALLLAAALLAVPAGARAASDPLEAVNRHVHDFNLLAHRYVLAPVAASYNAWTPAPVRAGISNAMANLGEPVTAASALLAGDARAAGKSAIRFGINTTLGLGGVRDAAAPMGYPAAPMRLGDALCRWGVPSGPYLVLPLLGPSTLRDAGGRVATSVALAPVVSAEAVVGWTAGSAFLDYADVHPELDRLEREALDSYATLRSVHLQRRAAACATDMAAIDEEDDD